MSTTTREFEVMMDKVPFKVTHVHMDFARIELQSRTPLIMDDDAVKFAHPTAGDLVREARLNNALRKVFDQNEVPLWPIVTNKDGHEFGYIKVVPFKTYLKDGWRCKCRRGEVRDRRKVNTMFGSNVRRLCGRRSTDEQPRTDPLI